VSPNKANCDPVYDDIFNSVFANKPHRSYKLREISDLRGKIIEQKFMRKAANTLKADEKRINQEFEDRQKVIAERLDAKQNDLNNKAQ